MRGATAATAMLGFLAAGMLAGCGQHALPPASPSGAAPATSSTAATPPRSSVAAAPVAWKGTPPISTGLQAALAVVPGGGIAFGSGSTLEVQVPGGWHRIEFAPGFIITRLVFPSADSGFLYGESVCNTKTTQEVFRSTDRGLKWQQVSGAHALPTPDERLVTAHGTFWAVDSVGWTFGPTSKDVLTSRDGITWSPAPHLPAGFTPLGVTPGQSAQTWLAGIQGSGGALYLGSQAVLKTPEPLDDVAFDGSVGLAVGGIPWHKFAPPDTATQTVYRTQDGGLHWVPVYQRDKAPASFSRIDVVSPTVAYALAGQVETGANGPGYQALYRTQDGGKSWTLVLQGRLAGAVALSATTAYADINGVLLATTDAGSHWAPVFSGALPVTWAAFSPQTPQMGWAEVNAGTRNLVLQTTDGGSSWQVLQDLGQDTPIAWFANDRGIVETPQGTLAAMQAGVQQTLPLPLSQANVVAAYFTSPQAGWVSVMGPGALEPALYHTTDGGRHWSRQSTPMPAYLLTAGSRSQLAVANGNGDWYTLAGPNAWSHGAWPGTLGSSQSVTLWSVAWNPDGSLWLAGTKSIAGPGQSTGFLWIVPLGHSTPTPHASSLVPETLGFATADSGWAVVNQALYLTRNGGTVWQYHSLHITSSLLAPGAP